MTYTRHFHSETEPTIPTYSKLSRSRRIPLPEQPSRRLQNKLRVGDLIRGHLRWGDRSAVWGVNSHREVTADAAIQARFFLRVETAAAQRHGRNEEEDLHCRGLLVSMAHPSAAMSLSALLAPRTQIRSSGEDDFHPYSTGISSSRFCKLKASARSGFLCQAWKDVLGLMHALHLRALLAIRCHMQLVSLSHGCGL